MPISRRYLPLACVVIVALVLGPAMAALLGRSPAAQAASIGDLQQQISAGQGQISSLADSVSAASSRLAALNGNIAGLEGQIARLQADLVFKQAQLSRIRDQLAAARLRLSQLIAYEMHAEGVLARQLVGSYQSGSPDLVGVVLDSHGFQDLLERLSFAQRIQRQDVQVIKQVRAARRAVAAQATRLGALEVRQQAITAQVLSQRNSLARTRVSLVAQQLGVAQIRSERSGQLAQARDRMVGLQQQLSQAEAAQAAQAAGAAQGAQGAQGAQATQDAVIGSPEASSGSAEAIVPSSGTVSPSSIASSGGFVFPMPKGAASPPGTWSLDQGVDISAPGGTPELAVCSGTIVLHGIGGFGPWAPVLHCDSPVGGYSYVYYGHAGPANQLPIGTHVGAGQVMSEVGPGIVGISTGPHLEIGFCDSSGTPLGSGTAPTMMSLLQAAYGG